LLPSYREGNVEREKTEREVESAGKRVAREKSSIGGLPVKRPEVGKVKGGIEEKPPSGVKGRSLEKSNWKKAWRECLSRKSAK